jgi:hypothetical protein
VTWQLRPSAEGVQIVEHGGDWLGQHAGFLMVSDRGFALTVLTNSEGGSRLVSELTVDDWALRRFAGVSNLPAVPRALSPGELAPYEGRYERQEIDPPVGEAEEYVIELRGDQGQLHATQTRSDSDTVGVMQPLGRLRWIRPRGHGKSGHSHRTTVNVPVRSADGSHDA